MITPKALLLALENAHTIAYKLRGYSDDASHPTKLAMETALSHILSALCIAKALASDNVPPS
jgi:hypothetical protein